MKNIPKWLLRTLIVLAGVAAVALLAWFGVSLVKFLGWIK